MINTNVNDFLTLVEEKEALLEAFGIELVKPIPMLCLDKNGKNVKHPGVYNKENHTHFYPYPKPLTQTCLYDINLPKDSDVPVYTLNKRGQRSTRKLGIDEFVNDPKYGACAPASSKAVFIDVDCYDSTKSEEIKKHLVEQFLEYSPQVVIRVKPNSTKFAIPLTITDYEEGLTVQQKIIPRVIKIENDYSSRIEVMTHKDQALMVAGLGIRWDVYDELSKTDTSYTLPYDLLPDLDWEGLLGLLNGTFDKFCLPHIPKVRVVNTVSNVCSKDLLGFLSKHNLLKGSRDDTSHYVVCPFNKHDRTDDAQTMLFLGGCPTFKCFSASCADNDYSDFIAKIGYSPMKDEIELLANTSELKVVASCRQNGILLGTVKKGEGVVITCPFCNKNKATFLFNSKKSNVMFECKTLECKSHNYLDFCKKLGVAKQECELEDNEECVYKIKPIIDNAMFNTLDIRVDELTIKYGNSSNLDLVKTKGIHKFVSMLALRTTEPPIVITEYIIQRFPDEFEQSKLAKHTIIDAITSLRKEALKNYNDNLLDVKYRTEGGILDDLCDEVISQQKKVYAPFAIACAAGAISGMAGIKYQHPSRLLRKGCNTYTMLVGGSGDSKSSYITCVDRLVPAMGEVTDTANWGGKIPIKPTFFHSTQALRDFIKKEGCITVTRQDAGTAFASMIGEPKQGGGYTGCCGELATIWDKSNKNSVQDTVSYASGSPNKKSDKQKLMEANEEATEKKQSTKFQPKSLSLLWGVPKEFTAQISENTHIEGLPNRTIFIPCNPQLRFDRDRVKEDTREAYTQEFLDNITKFYEFCLEEGFVEIELEPEAEKLYKEDLSKISELQELFLTKYSNNYKLKTILERYHFHILTLASLKSIKYDTTCVVTETAYQWARNYMELSRNFMMNELVTDKHDLGTDRRKKDLLITLREYEYETGKEIIKLKEITERCEKLPSFSENARNKRSMDKVLNELLNELCGLNVVDYTPGRDVDYKHSTFTINRYYLEDF